MVEDRTLRLVDLLADQALGLRLLTDGDPQTAVLGALPVEAAHPGRWLRPGWLMLTTGARFGGRPPSVETQRELVDDLDASGVAALCFSVGGEFATVPSTLLAEADRRGFPVVSVPHEVPFLHVVDAVQRSVQLGDVRLLRRTVALQDHLLEALADEQADASLVRRLAGLLRATVVLYDDAGEVLASSGVGPVQLIRSEVRVHPHGRSRFTIGRWHVLTEPITVGPVTHWLAIASRRRELGDGLAGPAVEAARRLLTMIVRTRRTSRVEERLRRAELLRLLVTGTHSDPQHLWDRLELYRFRRETPIRLLAFADARADGTSGVRRDAVTPERLVGVERAAADEGLRLLLTELDGETIGVVDAAGRELDAWLGRLPGTLHCGLSEPFHDLSQGPARFREAGHSLAAARRGGRTHLKFEAAGMLDWLIAGREPDAVEAKARQALAPLGDQPALAEALTAYFRCGCDIQRTARRLALHPNSVRYRLRRVEQLLGLDLRSPADIAEVQVCLRVSAPDGE